MEGQNDCDAVLIFVQDGTNPPGDHVQRFPSGRFRHPSDPNEKSRRVFHITVDGANAIIPEKVSRSGVKQDRASFFLPCHRTPFLPPPQRSCELDFVFLGYSYTHSCRCRAVEQSTAYTHYCCVGSSVDFVVEKTHRALTTACDYRRARYIACHNMTPTVLQNMSNGSRCILRLSPFDISL